MSELTFILREKNTRIYKLKKYFGCKPEYIVSYDEEDSGYKTLITLKINLNDDFTKEYLHAYLKHFDNLIPLENVKVLIDKLVPGTPSIFMTCEQDMIIFLAALTTTDPSYTIRVIRLPYTDFSNVCNMLGESAGKVSEVNIDINTIDAIRIIGLTIVLPIINPFKIDKLIITT
jgi:hypothetical protein